MALASLPSALGMNQRLDASARLQGSESAQVEAMLAHRFKSPFTKIALLRIAAGPAPETAEGRALLEGVSDALRKTPGVQGVISYLDRADALFTGLDSSSILIIGLSADNGRGDAAMASLRGTTDALRSQWAPKYPDLAFGWTGEAAVNADMRRLSAHETRAAELRVLPITLILLLAAFRSLTAALLPIICGALTIVVSLASIAAVNRIWPASIIVVSIISMVGLGLSIDYALLIVSRYRDELEGGATRPAAVREAARHGGRTVLLSGSAVAIGFGAMLWVPVSEVRSIGMGGLIVTTVAVLVAGTLLPVLLSTAGAWLDAGRLGRARKSASAGRWRRWAAWVSRRPILVLTIAAAPLLLLAAQAVHLRIDLPRGRWLPEAAGSVRVLHEIDSVARGNFGQIIEVVLDLPPGTRVPLGGPEILRQVPDAVRNNFVTADGAAARIELLPRRGLAATDAAVLVREIRAADPAALTGLAGTRIHVGGVPAFNVDYEDAIGRSFGRIVGLIVGSTLLALSVAFRSVLIPLKAVALNLLSVAAAFGAVTLVFQDGFGARLLGLPRALDGGFPIVPLLVFCIVFGLSMDYEVFLMARIADGRRAGLADADAFIEGIAGTGRVITFAAAIMLTVFGGFVFGEFVLVKILGFALGVAVLLDATVIRLGVGPALVQLAGRWNWWPGHAPATTGYNRPGGGAGETRP